MMRDDDTVRAAAAAIVATLDAQLGDLDAQAIVLTRDEALLALGLVGSLPGLIARDQARGG
jgi:hypothetical protein